ncbi:MAG: hypothetical protein ACOH1V_13805 [Stenotrophomonas sp.]
MKTRLILATGLLLGLSGCATYDYVGGAGGGYYHGSPSVQQTYPYGYGGYGGYGRYGYGSYGYDDYGYRGYRPSYIYYPQNHYRPPHGGQGNGHRPPTPGNGDGRPPRPPPASNSGNNKSPWRNLDNLQRPQSRANGQPQQRSYPQPQAMGSQRPDMQPRQAPQSRPAPVRREGHNLRQDQVRNEEL